ncbi:MAG: Ig domain-containing protein, partial [Clostridia bacterium]|nr:Ig domain-containing protein [Clostridia bacterium]
LTYVLGDNSIFKQASDAKLETELAKIEEKAGIIYSDKWLEKVSDNLNDKPTMQEIVGELREDGYTIKQVEVSGSEITGISLDKESMSLGKDKTGTIKVTLESSGELYTYYVLVEGKYYKMNFNGGAVTIDRTPSDILGEEEEKVILTATSENEGIATAVANSDTNTVDVTAKNTAGTVTITVTYGNFSKTCTVKVCEVTTELEIASVRARIAQGSTRWLSAVAKPIDTASQEFEWSSSNTEIATVDNKGVVTAKKAGTTTITAKTIDGSNKQGTCEVTVVENAPDVATLTDFQTANTVAKDVNGNLITVPGDFKVLTSEGTKVTEGIVIQDREGNEFVWVPVDSVSNRNK